ncbi:MAG: CPBP family intramembrane glutamic endopeptidase [Akkermansiaceae bacterium]
MIFGNNSSLSVKQTPSVWQLAFQGYSALICSVVLGVLACAPVLNSQVHYFYETNYILGARPVDDAQLRAWAMAKPGVVSFVAERQRDDLRVRSVYRGSLSQNPKQDELLTEMRRLGYEFRGMHGGSTGMANGIVEVITSPLTLAAMLAAIQVAFGLIGIDRIRKATLRGEKVLLFKGSSGRAVAFGALGGLGLLLLGVLNNYVLTAVLGHAPPSPWDSSEAMSPQTKLIFLLFGVIGAPIAEEIFFRGYLFRKFQRAGHIYFGLFFSSILFGVVHFLDNYNVPGICLFGFCLAWMYHRSGSILTPIVAHMVNNCVAILWMILP